MVHLALQGPHQTWLRGERSQSNYQNNQGVYLPPTATSQGNLGPPGLRLAPLEVGSVKITTNGALNFDEGRGGVGGVAHSSTTLLGSWCKPYFGVSDPLMMECLSLRDGVRFAAIRGLSHVIMEVDCLELVMFWKTRHNSRSVVAPILLEIGEVSNSFTLFDVQHVNQLANLPAHLCAKHACTLNITDCWLEDTPSFLVTSLLADYLRNAFV